MGVIIVVVVLLPRGHRIIQNIKEYKLSYASHFLRLEIDFYQFFVLVDDAAHIQLVYNKSEV